MLGKSEQLPDSGGVKIGDLFEIQQNTVPPASQQLESLRPEGGNPLTDDDLSAKIDH